LFLFARIETGRVREEVKRVRDLSPSSPSPLLLSASLSLSMSLSRSLESSLSLSLSLSLVFRPLLLSLTLLLLVSELRFIDFDPNGLHGAALPPRIWEPPTPQPAPAFGAI